jgi:hypothetical protein
MALRCDAPPQTDHVCLNGLAEAGYVRFIDDRWVAAG